MAGDEGFKSAGVLLKPAQATKRGIQDVTNTRLIHELA